MTTLDVKKLREMHEAGATTQEIAKGINQSITVVYDWMKKLGLKASGKHSRHRRNIYSVYDENDNLLAVGTAEECADMLGYKVQTIYRGVMVTKKGKAKERLYYKTGKTQ